MICSGVPLDEPYLQLCLSNLEKMIRLVDIYYDALDASKSGKKVKVPEELRAEMYPHHMEKGSELSYHSSYVLGQIYDRVDALKNDFVPRKDTILATQRI